MCCHELRRRAAEEDASVFSLCTELDAEPDAVDLELSWMLSHHDLPSKPPHAAPRLTLLDSTEVEEEEEEQDEEDRLEELSEAMPMTTMTMPKRGARDGSAATAVSDFSRVPPPTASFMHRDAPRLNVGVCVGFRHVGFSLWLCSC